MFRYELLDDSFVTETSTPSSDDLWDRPNTSTDWTVSGLRRDTVDGYGDLISDMDLLRGDTAWVVYVIYSSGDSFGFDDNAFLVPIHMFDSEKKARACQAAIWDHYNNSDPDVLKESRYSVEYIGNDGSVQKEYASWAGYFDRLSQVRVEKLTVIK